MSQNLTGTPSVLACVTEIVSAYLANNALPPSDALGFIRNVHATLRELEQASVSGAGWPPADRASLGQAYFHLSDVSPGQVQADPALRLHVQHPAVPIEDSVRPGYIVCLEDGKRLRMLKRYLRTHFGMTPEAYKAKWNLPADYPMAAPEVVEQRRIHAKTAGLGRRPFSSS